ncbi:hypothetical protein Dtox_1791 [Desulfofarcimen acetoxidans DSM 771]|jgi:hypothetical protein|uniref:Uncharacterized protein n=1 Tax=Desulfofarcimen acetoxidans (strain ATCC 49208 / DSM 771 / KCTC 5769 / VKM B-1644 / 5575) TaxID=485916 RepID=C8VXI8_DESAS|nr:hypothetical protein Dtox_1791 [Desulfofarcimen acetoxidans DSM 771]
MTRELIERILRDVGLESLDEIETEEEDMEW